MCPYSKEFILKPQSNSINIKKLLGNEIKKDRKLDDLLVVELFNWKTDTD
jgi:hypothetical protein